MDYGNKTFTITFGDQAENHVGMQKLGTMASSGFTLEDIKLAQERFKSSGYKTELINLTNDIIKTHPDTNSAYLLIVKKGVDCLLDPINKTSDDMFIEHSKLKVDKKAKMYGRVVNKHARHNLCFDDKSQKPDYENGKGRIVAFNKVPLTKKIRDSLPEYIGDKAIKLCAEGNYYYDITKCGIGYHGDAERRIVVGIRLGESLPICYQWYKNNKRIGSNKKIMLNHGDIYVMSDKTVGTDWKRKSILTLRHAAGANKYIK